MPYYSAILQHELAQLRNHYSRPFPYTPFDLSSPLLTRNTLSTDFQIQLQKRRIQKLQELRKQLQEQQKAKKVELEHKIQSQKGRSSTNLLQQSREQEFGHETKLKPVSAQFERIESLIDSLNHEKIALHAKRQKFNTRKHQIEHDLMIEQKEIEKEQQDLRFRLQKAQCKRSMAGTKASLNHSN